MTAFGPKLLAPIQDSTRLLTAPGGIIKPGPRANNQQFGNPDAICKGERDAWTL